MRIWTLHPQYLDTKGLLAVWRETLLAKHVIEGKTKGYRNHPQIIRFKYTKSPADAINEYLISIYDEAKKRGFSFDRSKIADIAINQRIEATDGQVLYEKNHLLAKLKIRDPQKYSKLLTEKEIKIHPMFDIIPGDIEQWEKIVK